MSELPDLCCRCAYCVEAIENFVCSKHKNSICPEYCIDCKDFEPEQDTDDCEYDDYDWCYECGGYGDDYYWDEMKQEYVSACDGCPHNSFEWDDTWDD